MFAIVCWFDVEVLKRKVTCTAVSEQGETGLVQ